MKIITTISLVSTLLVLAGCTSTRSSISTLNSETPIVSASSMTPLLKCVADNVTQAHQKKGAYDATNNPQGIKKLLVIIDDDQFTDGTIRKEASTDGPLADGNQTQIKAILNRWIPSDILTLPSREIPLLRRSGLKGSSITEFGTLQADSYIALSKQYQADNIVYFSGAFTKLDDETPLLDSGSGSHVKNDGTVGGAVSKGNAQRESVVGLSTSLGHVGTNTEISSTMIEARMHKHSSEIKFSLIPGETNVALSKKIILSEGVQGTQQMLLEAAALWFVGLAYPEDAGLGECLNSSSNPGEMLRQQQVWQSLDETSRIASIQALLHGEGVLDNGYQHGKLDAATKQAIRDYDAAYGLFHTPHIESNLDSLYLHLISLKPPQAQSH